MYTAPYLLLTYAVEIRSIVMELPGAQAASTVHIFKSIAIHSDF